ncbi:transposase [Komagataeibacter pomaceti]|nr:transposase [Novacetimonas pomaceti]
MLINEGLVIVTAFNDRVYDMPHLCGETWMRRYGLSYSQWERIKDFLPGREGHVGGTVADNRLFIEAVLYRYRAGIPWRDLSVRFGDWKNVGRRLRCWRESGVIERIFRHLAADHANDYMMLTLR